MEKLNTHYYDGKLFDKIYDQFRGKRLAIEQITDFYAAILYFHDAPGIEIIKRNIYNNYDYSDEIDSSVVIVEIYKKIKGLPPEKWIIEQINDILGGQCLQGRSKRLCQILMSL